MYLVSTTDGHVSQRMCNVCVTEQVDSGVSPVSFVNKKDLSKILTKNVCYLLCR